MITRQWNVYLIKADLFSIAVPLISYDIMDDLQSVQRFQSIQEEEKEYRLKIIGDFLL